MMSFIQQFYRDCLVKFALMGMYPGPEAVEHFAPVLKERGYKYSKGAIQFPYGNVPLELIREIAQYCGKE